MIEVGQLRRWTYEDEMLLEVTFVHPTTGETMVATRHMW